MNLAKNNLTIRNALPSDAEQLCAWWNDGEVMAHAGFPNGLNTTADEIRESLAGDDDKTHRRHIIELDGRPIGEMNYRSKGGGTAEIGIKICDFSEQNKGLGTSVLSIFIDALFTYYGYSKIILDTNKKNARAQRVYEKLGFEIAGVRESAWRDQLGEMQSAIDYSLNKESWVNSSDYIHIREERPDDYYAVEELTRDAFWEFKEKSWVICDEHLLVHRLREAPSFVPELDLAAEKDGKIVGHIIYSISKIVTENDESFDVLTFGPLSVHPSAQNKGIGKALLRHSLKIAKHLNYRAVIIYGHPDYYPRVGFKRAAEFGLTDKDGKAFDAFMAYPLYDGALDGVRGRHFIDPVYEGLTQDDALEFDKKFPKKSGMSFLVAIS